MKRDDIIEYSLDAHHSEEEGKKIRKKIWIVTAILTVITAVEVLMGAFLAKDESLRTFLVASFLIMTVVKAAYIVLVFMHLGDERKMLKRLIITPYAMFILYLIFILLHDSNVLFNIRQSIGL